MKKIILRYGLYAGLAELVFFVLTWLIITVTGMGHRAQGWLGYMNIFCPMVFVYFGIRYFRDCVNEGRVSFLQALKVGMLIVIIPTASFAVIESLYVLYIDPRFYENISAYDIEQYRKTLPPAEFAVKLKEMKQQVALSKNPFYNFVSMILVIGSAGAIVAVISALLLYRKPSQGSAGQVSVTR